MIWVTFTLSKLIIDRFLHFVSWRRLEKWQELYTPHVDLKNAFESSVLGTLGHSVDVWDSCKDYWPSDWGSWKIWGKAFLGCLLIQEEAGVCPFSITVQHLYGLDIRQICWLKSLWSICWQHQSYFIDFVFDDVPFMDVGGGPGDGSQVLHEEVNPLGLKVSWPLTKV